MKHKKESLISETMILVTTLSVIIPISLSFWIMSLIGASPLSEVSSLPSPMRWLMSVSCPIFIALWGLKRKSIDWSGAITGLIVGFILTISNYCFLTSLMIFFISSSKATKYKSAQKRTLEEHFKEGGQRNWVQVICNGGVASQLALLYMIENGTAGEIPINFTLDYNASWFGLSVLGALACANGDTYASELGSVLSKDDPRLITTLGKVPKGTNGGVSLIGLIVSGIGGLLIGLGYYVTVYLCVNRELLSLSPPQWPIIIIGMFGGFFGSIIDSILGATLQYSGIDTRTGKVVETPGDGVQHISGIRVLDNHSVNLLSTLITALITPQIGLSLWSYIQK